MWTCSWWAAGLRAGRAAEAAAAAAPGLSILLVEDGVPGAAEAANGHVSRPGLRMLMQASAVALQPGNMVVVHERRPTEPFLADRMLKVRAGCVILATGAVEQPLVLAGNDRPA